LGVSPSTLARVVSMRSAVSPEMALRLSKALGRSPESWLAQRATQARRHGRFRRDDQPQRV
jgi:addiction module HigA family antidote